MSLPEVEKMCIIYIKAVSPPFNSKLNANSETVKFLMILHFTFNLINIHRYIHIFGNII